MLHIYIYIYIYDISSLRVKAHYIFIQPYFWRNLLCANKGLIVNSVFPPLPLLLPFSIYVHTNAALRRVLNVLCGAPVGWNRPALMPKILKVKTFVYEQSHVAGPCKGGKQQKHSSFSGLRPCLSYKVKTLLWRLRWAENVAYLIYLLTEIGLTPGGSSTVHIYTKTIHRTTQLTTLVGRLSGIQAQRGRTKINDELTA